MKEVLFIRSKIIMHTQISLDGGIHGFDDTSIYYSVANRLNTEMILFGSDTVFKAAEQYPAETEKAFIKPADDPNDKRPVWVIPDSQGKLRNLHVFRDSEYCKDIIVLVSATTPQSYIEFLKERYYDFISVGNDHVDYAKALEILYDKYNCKTIRTDSGGILTNILLEQGLVDEISLVVSPCLVGTDIPRVFRSLTPQDKINLELISCDVMENDYISLVYQVSK